MAALPQHCLPDTLCGDMANPSSSDGSSILPAHPKSHPCTSGGQTVYIPTSTPPTPVPSPKPLEAERNAPLSPTSPSFALPSTPASRLSALSALIHTLSPAELVFISTTIAPLLKRDLIGDFPPEIGLHVLSFVDEPKTITRAAQVSKTWRKLVRDDGIWRRLCSVHGYPATGEDCGYRVNDADDDEPLLEMEQFATVPMDPALEWLMAKRRQHNKDKRAFAGTSTPADPISACERQFRKQYTTIMNWRHGGTLLRSHRVPTSSNTPSVTRPTSPQPGSAPPDPSAAITCLAIDPSAAWIVVGLANCRIHVFSARTGVLSRTLVGHVGGVWSISVVGAGGHRKSAPVLSTAGVSTTPASTPPRRKSKKKANEGQRRRKSEREEEGGQSSLSPRRKSEQQEEENGRGSSSATMRRRRSQSPDVEGSDSDTPSASDEEDDEPPGLHRSIPASLRSALGLDGPKHPERPPATGPGKPSDPAFASEGWGQPNPIVVSCGSDKTVRVWDLKSGYCIYNLTGHTSTIRCLQVLHHRPIAITGSRDMTLRVWDIRRGTLLRVLSGHSDSVRCLDACGNRVVSGSYDTTLRVWNVDTGECIHVLQGHYHQIYCVAFDGVVIASGGLDTTVRVWDAESGHCTALLQSHSSLVCQIRLSPTILATGGSDGRIVTFLLANLAVQHQLLAHEASVTSIQFDERFLVTSGNDGRTRLYDSVSGALVRELSAQGDTVWKVAYRGDVLAVMCRRAGKTVMEIWSMRPMELE